MSEKTGLQVSFVTISEDHLGQRIDNFLITHLKGVPKSAVYKILRKGEVRVNKKRIKPVYKLQLNDVVAFRLLKSLKRKSSFRRNLIKLNNLKMRFCLKTSI